jgi:hypothetical protein
MATYKQVRILRGEDAAYLAGLMDGEGTVSLSRKHRLQNRQFEISISNTEEKILEYVRDVTGVGRIVHRRTYRSPRHKPSMAYVVNNRQALSLLKQIAPYLKSIIPITYALAWARNSGVKRLSKLSCMKYIKIKIK